MQFFDFCDFVFFANCKNFENCSLRQIFKQKCFPFCSSALISLTKIKCKRNLTEEVKRILDLLTSYCLQFNFRLHLSKYYDDDHKNDDDNDNHDHDDDVNNDDIDDDSSPIS